MLECMQITFQCKAPDTGNLFFSRAPAASYVAKSPTPTFYCFTTSTLHCLPSHLIVHHLPVQPKSCLSRESMHLMLLSIALPSVHQREWNRYGSQSGLVHCLAFERDAFGRDAMLHG